ncbi:MAG: hypothetical protein DRI61_08860 [Chloroflexi bacterium]|nr:MAG: hypothetical protein DRI61_08860 [Chloroflexota bacterium]
MNLPDWPRPPGDNGRGVHFLGTPYYSDEDLDRNVARIKELGLKWCVVVYGDEIQLERAARRFKAAGIYVIWRKMVRPFQRYYDWGRDIKIIQEIGLPPYMQVYNEPSLPAEWEGHPIDEQLFIENLLYAVRDVYNNGGYVGLQFLNRQWLVDALRAIKERKGERIFNRMFFVAHSYGLNHPPDYAQDENAALGFLIYADIFQQEIGFVPPIIVGEGGWKIGSDEDNRYPPIDEKRHRDYHIEVYNWFCTGQLSNGQPLPDYLFAFCPWLIAAKLDDRAWYDSFAGDRNLLIEALKNMPSCERKFSWER